MANAKVEIHKSQIKGFKATTNYNAQMRKSYSSWYCYACTGWRVLLVELYKCTNVECKVHLFINLICTLVNTKAFLYWQHKIGFSVLFVGWEDRETFLRCFHRWFQSEFEKHNFLLSTLFCFKGWDWSRVKSWICYDLCTCSFGVGLGHFLQVVSKQLAKNLKGFK